MRNFSAPRVRSMSWRPRNFGPYSAQSSNLSERRLAYPKEVTDMARPRAVDGRCRNLAAVGGRAQSLRGALPRRQVRAPLSYSLHRDLHRLGLARGGPCVVGDDDIEARRGRKAAVVREADLARFEVRLREIGGGSPRGAGQG